MRISLGSGWSPPWEGEREWNANRGGPHALLGWLEQALGVRGPPVPPTRRVMEYLHRLERSGGKRYLSSLEADRWATAAELLERRDHLLMSGWDPTAAGNWPPLVADLANAEAAGGPLSPGLPERLRAVLDALETRQRLPPHVVLLEEPAELWPPLWRRVLGKLNVKIAPAPALGGAERGSLRLAQENVASGTSNDLRTDASFRFLRAASVSAACQAVAAMLAKWPGDLRRVVVACEDEFSAQRMDASLRSRGVPTMGVERRSVAQPAVQALPLALKLCWEPVDPYALLDLLMLSVGPIPTELARPLARALQEQPGLGSDEWNRVVGDLTAPRADSDGSRKEALDRWFTIERTKRPAPLPAALVEDRCRLIEQWATGRAAMQDKPDGDLGLTAALRSAAAQARALGDVALSYGASIGEPQLVRILDAIADTGAVSEQLPTLAGGPRWGRSLAEVPDGAVLVIWLGTGTLPEPSSRWTRTELQALRAASVDIDDGARVLDARRMAERNGLARIPRLLVIQMPPRAEERVHPLWLEIERKLPQPPEHAEARLEDIAEGRIQAPADLPLEISMRHVVPPPAPALGWKVPNGIADRVATISATSLEARLGCGVKWLLRYAAHIRPSPAEAIPEGSRLAGTFGHAVFGKVLRPGAPLPTPDQAAAEVEKVFDSLLAANAAPLTLPHKLMERERLKRNLSRSAREFVTVLRRGGYRVVGMELPLEGELDGHRWQGRMDCLLERDEGQEREETIVDFKHGWTKGRRDALESGKALQLAAYAGAREAAGGGPVRGVAYLIFDGSIVLTPDGSPLAGVEKDDRVAGPSVKDVWERMVKALREADALVETIGEVSAHPLQPPDQWPEHAKLLLDEREEEQAICKFCDFAAICGLKGVM